MRRRNVVILLLATSVLAIVNCGDVSGIFSSVSDETLPPLTLYWAVKAVDLDGDGKVDIVDLSVYSQSNTPDQGSVNVYLQNSSGAPFAMPNKYSTSSKDPMKMTVGDLNNDGRPDVVTVNALLALATSPNNVSLLLQDAASPGHFLPAVLLDTGNSPQYAAIGDLNHDGLNDIAVATRQDVTLLLQNTASQGTFTRSTLAVGFSNSVAIADLNNDGYSDIVTTNASVVSVSLQNPSVPGTFQSPVTYPADIRPSIVVIADLNADRFPDLVVLNSGDPNDGTTARVSVLMQDPVNVGTFHPPVNYKASRGLNAVAIADLNHDEHPDLAVANGDGNLSVLLQDASGIGIFAAAKQYTSNLGVQDVSVADVNGDGFNDLIYEDVNGTNVRYQNSGAPGTFATAVLITK